MNGEAGKRSTSFWIGTFLALMTISQAFLVVVLGYLKATDRQEMQSIVELHVRSRLEERDKVRANEMTMLREALAEIRSEIRTIRDRIK